MSSSKILAAITGAAPSSPQQAWQLVADHGDTAGRTAAVVVCVIVVAVLALLFYVVYTMKPKRLKLTGAFWRASFSFEADSGAEPKELPPGDAGP